MDVSLFLAKVYGLYLIIIGLGAYIIRKDSTIKMTHEFLDNQPLLSLSGVLNLIIGLLVVVAHPIFELSWRLIITILGLISIAKAAWSIFIPYGKDSIRNFIKGNTLYYCGIICILIGIFLLYKGFS